jgi:hypothetical protein
LTVIEGQTTPSQWQDRTIVREARLARSGVSGGRSTLDVSFYIRNPSIRLYLTVHVFARPNDTASGGHANAHDYTNETWQLYAVAEGTPDVRTNAVFVDPTTNVATAVGLPDTYEGTTGVKQLQGDAHFVAQGVGDTDDYIVQCVWEPAPGGERMCDAEWAALAQSCQVKSMRNDVPNLA